MDHAVIGDFKGRLELDRIQIHTMFNCRMDSVFYKLSGSLSVISNYNLKKKASSRTTVLFMLL